MKELIEKLSALPIDQIAEIVTALKNDFSTEAGIVWNAALGVLESKMSEADFVRFCDKL